MADISVDYRSELGGMGGIRVIFYELEKIPET